MKFIIDLFEQEEIHEVALKIGGDIVSKKENLVIVSSKDEYSLRQEMTEKFPNLDFNSYLYINQ